MPPFVKCLVWDLDNTLWSGVLLENDEVVPRPEAVEAIRTLDARGVLHSIASRNDPALAEAELHRLGLAEYFLCPRIGWSAKSASVAAIAGELNLGTDALAFVDDEPYEREEVAFALPEVRCYDAAEVGELAGLPEFTPRSVTRDASRRRAMYRADARRKTAEENDTGPQEEFLRGLGMRFRIAPAGPDDLPRAEELTVRTNQLNTTGRTYSFAELDELRISDRHLLLTAELEDRFGPYGTIGLVLVEKEDRAWTIRLLLMSCRVAARGAGSVLIGHLRRLAAAAGVRLCADFVPTGRNRMMYATYRFNGFAEVTRTEDRVLLEADLTCVPPDPSYVEVLAA